MNVYIYACMYVCLKKLMTMTEERSKRRLFPFIFIVTFFKHCRIQRHHQMVLKNIICLIFLQLFADNYCFQFSIFTNTKYVIHLFGVIKRNHCFLFEFYGRN